MASPPRVRSRWLWGRHATDDIGLHAGEAFSRLPEYEIERHLPTRLLVVGHIGDLNL